MSYSGTRHDIELIPSRSLSVTQCGLTICDKGHKTPSRIYGHYSVHFILEGKGCYRAAGKSYELSAGQGFMIFPDIPNSYEADEKEPWKYIYANFSGIDDDAIVHYSGINENNVTFSFDLSEDMLNDIYAMYKASSKNGAKGYDVTGYFLLVMSRLIKSCLEKPKNDYLLHHYVSKAVSFIEDNYPNSITVSDIASFIGIERTYLHRIFQKATGTTPLKYLSAYRLSKAELLMRHDNMSLSDIAHATGFYDVAHFSKAFISKNHISPNQYRRNLKCQL